MKWQNQIHQSLILKTKALGETDKLVVAISQERGRFLCIAKGARQMKSSKRAVLESGNLAQLYLLERKSSSQDKWPLMTQAKLVADCSQIRSDLQKLKQLYQFLEVLDKVLVEEELDELLMKKIEVIREMIICCRYQNCQIKKEIEGLLVTLGFWDEEGELKDRDEKGRLKTRSITDFMAELTNQKMKSYAYLTVD